MTMPIAEHLVVTLSFDDENRVWYVSETDLPGLCVEAATMDGMRDVIDDVAPDLRATNLPAEKRNWPIRLQHLLSFKSSVAA
jgi:hypothetical protein